ncbi:microsomal glutathione S-transferase 1-like [Osmia bicornis bicornis]|uniref:microsomal glutathione S-transferase 1-like n=1 Tax=Osmia bicornis bicornis TaxID=1437191 RepID=UPI0010F9DA1D|nr:microsomal glutathione S-transferase 1-like [Osmia bicornis bicornis]
MTTYTAPIINPELLKIYCFWGSILAIKLLAMVPLTARQRYAKKVFTTEEDAKWLKNSKVVHNDPDVERVRRAHLNDLENIPVWYIVTLLWLTTGPSIWLAGTLIRTFVIARIIHTISYTILQKQPHRALAFFVGIFVTVYEIISTIIFYL